jgi:diguanylate cyclase (GGDEF)-like protein
MEAAAEPGGRVLVVAESGHESLVRVLSAEGHDVDTRLPASALGPPPDVVVAVHASSGAAVLASLERRFRLPVAPVIVLSGGVSAKERAGLLRAGAHTCLPDPIDPDELRAAVAGALAIQRSRNASANGPGDLADPLTGLGNRRLGERELELFVARSARHGNALAVVMAAVDGDAGDGVVHDAGARLAHTLRSGDVIARWGGPEFLMMLPDTDPQGTHRAAERLRQSISAAPFSVGPETIELTASVGWADWRGEDPSEFKLRGERSLQQAREAGGDAVRP